tara:strand:- start:2624 stop:3385 length:762 start_codon:yes stop_codon:yes gene_type:complete
MSNKIYIFDCDGTLTPSRQKMTEDFSKFFSDWSSRNKFYLVTGSDLDKMKEQIPLPSLDKAEGLFCCGGNQLWELDKNTLSYNKVYSRDFQPHKALIDYLQQQLKDSSYKGRYGTHIENRGSMLNFSVVGRDCSLDQRYDYYEWDRLSKERENICFTINHMWPQLEAVCGGQISIDIAPKGWNKAQVLDNLEEKYSIPFGESTEYIFIGDRTEEGGNDYPLAKRMNDTQNCRVFQTEGPDQTMEILQTIEAEK